MKPIQYPDNGNGFIAEYHRTREGPSYFMVYYKKQAQIRADPKDAWRILGTAKFTDASKEFKEWCLEMHQKYVLDKQEKPEPDGRADTSFASEAIKEEEPNDNTKLITWDRHS